LEHSPDKVSSSFYCSYNQITSLEHCPHQVGGEFSCHNNPVNSIVDNFIRSYRKNEFIELFNYTDIIQDDTIITWFYEEIAHKLPTDSRIEKHYTIVR